MADLDVTAGAILVLAPRWPTHSTLITNAITFVLDAQSPQGTCETSWTINEASVILRTVDALATAHTLHTHPATPGLPEAVANPIPAAVTRSIARLLDTQNHDGGWSRRPEEDSGTLATAQALPVIARHPNPGPTLAARTFLLERQHDNGSFPAAPDQVGPRPAHGYQQEQLRLRRRRQHHHATPAR